MTAKELAKLAADAERESRGCNAADRSEWLSIAAEYRARAFALAMAEMRKSNEDR